MDGLHLNMGDVLRRALKYIIEGIMVALAAFAIPNKRLNMSEILMIALTAAATFSIFRHIRTFSCHGCSFRSRIWYWSKSC